MAAKTYDYIVTLKPSRNAVAFDWISQLLLVLALTAGIYMMLTTPLAPSRADAVIFSIIVLAAGLYARFYSGSFQIALWIAGAAWLYLFEAYWIALLYLFSGILEKQVKFKREIGFDNEGVTINSFPVKKYSWDKVRNVILKDNIITVDLHNNRLLQKELENDPGDALVQELNEFCSQRLPAA